MKHITPFIAAIACLVAACAKDESQTRTAREDSARAHAAERPLRPRHDSLAVPLTPDEQRFAGPYRGDHLSADGASTVTTLSLNADRTFSMIRHVGTERRVTRYRGSWTAGGTSVTLKMTEFDGKPAKDIAVVLTVRGADLVPVTPDPSLGIQDDLVLKRTH